MEKGTLDYSIESLSAVDDVLEELSDFEWNEGSSSAKAIERLYNCKNISLFRALYVFFISCNKKRNIILPAIQYTPSDLFPNLHLNAKIRQAGN